MPRPLTTWKRFRYRLEVWAVRIVLFLVPRLSRRSMIRTARILARLAYRIDTRGREVALANLAAAFPDRSEAERIAIARRAYFHFAVNAIDLFWASRNLTAATSDRYVRYEVDDPVDFDQIGGSPAIMVTPHYGTFEWLSMEWALRRPAPMIIAEDFKNPVLTGIFTRLRETTGITIIPQQRAMFRQLRHLKRGGQVAFMSDLTVKPNKAATLIKCFGFSTCVTILHAFLAKQTGVPIVPVICLPQDDGTYVFRFFRSFRPNADATPGEIAQSCWDVFEPLIRERPAPWLWMYKHWRHLPADPADAARYPFYAKRSEKFAAFETTLEDNSRPLETP